ncbi:unnamed protein product, partial [Closterium sp. NIES-53]
VLLSVVHLRLSLRRLLALLALVVALVVCVLLPSPFASSLPAFPDPESDSFRAASPTVARFLATVVTDPSLASTAASALVAELVDFAASCRLDYAASLVAESASVCPPSVGGECALSTDVLEDRQEEFQSCFALLDWSCDLLFSPTLPMGLHCCRCKSPTAPIMASPTLLTFDAEGRAVAFDVWLDDLQLFLQCDSKDGLSLFDLTSGASTAPAADADSTSAKTLYDAVVARYSSPATTALSRLMLPYLFPDLAAFATVTDLIMHLRTSDTRYRAALPTEGAPLFLFCPPLPLLLLSILLAPSRSALRLLLVRGTASARASGARELEGVVGAAVVAVEAEEGVGVGVVVEVGASVAAVEVEAAVAVAGGVGEAEAVAAEVELAEAELCSGDPSSSSALVRPLRPSSFSAAPGTRESATPGAGESALSGIASAQVFHTFTLDSGASRSFFRDRTTLTPLSRPVAVSLADPSGGPVLARYSTVLPCPVAPSGSLSGLYLPRSPRTCQRVIHCTCAQTGRHLATFTRRPGSGLYTLTTESPLVAASGQVAASSQVFAAASRSGPESAPCSCRLLSHQTLHWHHRLGHPSLPRLRGMASRVLVSGLPRSLPPLPPGPARTCVPCVEGRQRAAPHSSEFPPTEAPLQTLHMDVWGPARVHGQGHERYFLLVVDDFSRYTTVFPLCSKGEVTEVLIDWIRVARLQLRERFGSDFPVLRLHSDRGGDFSSDLLQAFCRAEGIRHMFSLQASPQQNGIAERRIGMVMDVARTSMIHTAAPHFLWPFAVLYTAHQINLQPRVSLPETSPTLRWTGKVGDASAFRVWGSRAFVRDLSADKLSSRAVPCVFLGFPPDAPGWQFYHPTSRRVLSSQDVTFDESVPYYRLFPYRLPPSPPRRSSSRPVPPR